MSIHSSWRVWRRGCAVAITMTVVACGTGGVRPTTSATHSSLRADPSGFPRANSRLDLIGASEIASMRLAMTAYDVVQQLRPHYFFPRGVATAGTRSEPEVYLDNMRLGSAQSLRTIPIGNVEDIRYLQPAAASLWLPPGQIGPVILVRSRQP